MATPRQFLEKMGLLKKTRRAYTKPSVPMSAKHSEQERALFADVNALQKKYPDLKMTIVVYDKVAAIAHVSNPYGWGTY